MSKIPRLPENRRLYFHFTPKYDRHYGLFSEMSLDTAVAQSIAPAGINLEDKRHNYGKCSEKT